LSARFRDSHWAQRDLLARNPLFSGLARPHFDELIAASRLLDLPAGHVLYRAGEPVREAHVLFSGSVKRSTTLAGATKKIIELVQSPQMLSLGELFGAAHYASCCTVITPCVIVAIDIHKLRGLIQRSLDLSWRIIQALAERQCAVEFDVTGHHYGLTGTQRVLDYLLEQAGDRARLAGETTVTLKASKKMIAGRIGMTPESFSRNLRQLSDSGFVVVEGRNVHIQNAALLDTEIGNSTQRLNFSRKSRTDGRQPEKSLSFGALINSCGRLRMLSQRLCIAWAQIAFDIAPARGRVKLRQLALEFARNLERLTKLDPPGGVGERLAVVAEIWPGYRQVLLAEEIQPSDGEQVLALSEAMLGATDALVAQAEQLAGTPEARYVNIAGRNRMLSQRIGKFFLFQEQVGDAAAVPQQAAASCREFERNLDELQRGGQNLPELAAQLREVAGQWHKFIRTLQPDLAHGHKAKHAQSVIGEGDRLLRLVDTAVKLYERLSK
jgi:CRP-like cAMP-binding protein